MAVYGDTVGNGGGSSDYGSDFGSDVEDQLVKLMAGIDMQNEQPSLDEQVPFIIQSVERHDHQSDSGFARAPRLSSSASSPNYLHENQEQGQISLPRGPSVEIEYDGDDIFDDLETFPPNSDSPGRIRFEDSNHPTTDQIQGQAQSSEQAVDTRSPLQRFRTAPKKPLSVTDLVSPAWCELQYFFNLSQYGRKPATPAMKRGSSVHKELEEQVHETVQVDVQTREDHWGLKLWNVIQGLRTLRITGMTRELEIWGTIDGQVINGVIDELSYFCTDSDLESRLSNQSTSSKPTADPTQRTISQFFASQRASSTTSPPPNSPSPKIYLTDIKTRTHPSLPRGSSLRPTYMQLMLYRHLLTLLANGSTDPTTLFTRYSLSPNTPFSEPLLATLATLDYNFRSDATASSLAPISSDVASICELYQHNTLAKLWSLMLSEFARAIPNPTTDISRVLAVEFRRAADGGVLGKVAFPHDDDAIKRYVADEMAWWRGERPARGVDVEESFKCGMCAFAESCEWRKERVDADVNRSRVRQTAPQSK